ncbi:hypothetical protein CKO_01920 [Citrobacter koseri ATCC BAA-895]|uniref:Uncharacterized protein n=1 Tax=Citrobacter koseri (strain ATCC BAA-895 / CDC 4225-83 / SGSC4696) TaxID=290338 RepID=A8AHT3_CITK8|nr:hypothetical protein CKO_01920 [Citrobacter koseri ATCC BAA-895]
MTWFTSGNRRQYRCAGVVTLIIRYQAICPGSARSRRIPVIAVAT